MIKPGEIPQFTGDLGQLETDCADLKKDAGKVRRTGGEVHSQFQGLSAYYSAPEAEQLFATTKPVKDRADAFGDDLETVSSALSSYATEIRPLVDRLKQLKADATVFVDSVEDDDEWEYDGDKVEEHNQLRDDITATVAAFWAAERACHNKITALWGGTRMVAGDGSDRKDQYGYAAKDMDNAKLPWGDPVEEKHQWYEIGHWVKSFVWDGLIVDGVWATVKGLGTLVGFGGWDAMGQAWKGLAQLSTGLTLSLIPGAQLAFWALPDDKLPSWIRDSRTAMKETGKALVAWDQWGKNPARAAGAVTFNVVTTVFTGGAGAGASGAGKAGAAAKALSVAGKAGRALDPMTYVVKGTGAGLSKIGDIAKGLKGVGAIDVPTLPDGSVHLPDGRLMDPNGNLISSDGTIDTTPVPRDVGSTVPHGAGATSTLSADGTLRGAQQPVASAAHTGTDAAARTFDNARNHHGPTPAASHTPGGGADATPSPSAYDQTPTTTPHTGGRAVSGTPHGTGHDTPGAGHADDASHGAGHGGNGVGHLGRSGDEAAATGRGSDETAPPNPADDGATGHHEGHPSEGTAADDAARRAADAIQLGDSSLPLPGPGEKVLGQVPTNPNGLISHVGDQPVDDFLRDLSYQRGAAYREAKELRLFSRKQAGECVGVVMDLRTGRVIEGINGKSDNIIPSAELHPTLAARFESISTSPPHPDHPLGHAEVKAANELLWERTKQGLPDGDAALAELRASVEFPYKSHRVTSLPGAPAPFCANCNVMLDGLKGTAGRFTGSPPSNENWIP